MTEQKSVGFIYIFQNPAFKQYVKIGYAANWQERLASFDCTAVPFAFKPIAYCEVPKVNADKDLHRLIDKLRPELRAQETTASGRIHKREFYEIGADEACEILEIYARSFSSKAVRIKPSTEQIKDEKIATATIERTTLRAEFWCQFDKYYKSRDNLFDGVNIANNFSWCSKSVGGNKYTFSVNLNSVSACLTVKNDVFNRLHSNRANIDKMFILPPTWDIAKNEIKIENADLRIMRTETWQSIFEFMTTTMKTLKECLTQPNTPV
jgi:hypothetical protein